MDYDYAFNRLSHMLDLEEPYQDYDATIQPDSSVDALLEPLLDHAVDQGLIERDTTQMRDLFESELMDILTPLPSTLQTTFDRLLSHDPVAATDAFYQRSKASNYIKTARIAKNDFFTVDSPYGTMEITINLSKPEKDPKAIAAAQKSGPRYPKCLLCKENVGYYGRADHPGRSNHRAVKVPINDEPFFLQFSPYVYYNEHAIVFHESHIPMDVSEKTFKRLFDFVDMFPHYFLGSNAGLPIVGGSILSHEHYQGGNAMFPLDKAEAFETLTMDDVTVELLEWPLSVIRMSASDRASLIEKAERLRQYFKTYENKALGIIPYTEETPHNAITPILRKMENKYVLSIALRNNRTDAHYPDGIFHPHPEKHHIKKENIGLIEVMGLAILPGRLQEDLIRIKDYLEGDKTDLDGLEAYEPWIRSLDVPESEETLSYLKSQAGKVFVSGLEDCGVFKQDDTGRAAFSQFLKGWIQCESQKQKKQ